MKNRIEELRQSRSSYAVRWRDFILKVSTHSNDLHCFFENKDSAYYGLRIILLADVAAYVDYRCGGKEGVLKLYELINKSPDYKECRVLFFVDRDFDPDEHHPVDSRIYVTDCYSIENYYISPNSISNIVANGFGVDPLGDEKELESIVERCVEMLGSFIDMSREINAWVAAIRDEERLHDGMRKRLNLRSKDITNFVDPSLDGNIKQYSLNELPDRFGISGPAQVSLTIRLDAFSNCDGCTHFRGKWLLEAFRKYLVELQHDRRATSPRFFSKRGPARLQLSRENLVSEFSQYADTPESLKRFLKN